MLRDLSTGPDALEPTRDAWKISDKAQ